MGFASKGGAGLSCSGLRLGGLLGSKPATPVIRPAPPSPAPLNGERADAAAVGGGGRSAMPLVISASDTSDMAMATRRKERGKSTSHGGKRRAVPKAGAGSYAESAAEKHPNASFRILGRAARSQIQIGES